MRTRSTNLDMRPPAEPGEFRWWLTPTPPREEDLKKLASLSKMQRAVVELIAAGRTHAEIGLVLGNSTKTIDTHRAAAIKKLGVRNNADLTRFAIRVGIAGVHA